MKVFLSWSGERSQKVAQALGPWTKKMVQSTDYWVSSDLERGVKWLAEISKSLDEHSFGVLCVTPENVDAVWLNFEAGALSKHLGDTGRVIPYLMGFQSLSDLKEPLGQFNACLASKDGTWELIKTINNHAEFKLGDAELAEAFDVWWPGLEVQLTDINEITHTKPLVRKSDDKLDEALLLLREISRSIASQPDFMIDALISLLGRAPSVDTQSTLNELAHSRDFASELRVRDVAYSLAEEMFGKPSTRGMELSVRENGTPLLMLPASLVCTSEQVGELMRKISSKVGERVQVTQKRPLTGNASRGADIGRTGADRQRVAQGKAHRDSRTMK